MKKLKRILKRLSIIPFKVVTLKTGIVVKHYSNGNLRID